MSEFTEARLERIGRRLWRTIEPLRFYIGYRGSTAWIEVPAGFVTDGPSYNGLARVVLALTGWLIPGAWLESLMRPAIVHDRLREDGRFRKIVGDAMFLVAMEAAGTPSPLREIAFLGVRLNASRKRRNPEIA